MCGKKTCSCGETPKEMVVRTANIEALRGKLQITPPEHFTPVDRRSRHDLSYEEYLEKYVRLKKPIVITGYDDMEMFQINSTVLQKHCGNVLVRFDEYIEENALALSCEQQAELDCRLLAKSMGPLDEFLNMIKQPKTLTEYFKYMENVPSSNAHVGAGRDIMHYALGPLYVHDIDFQNLCPSLMSALKLPKYFAHDFLQCEAGVLLKDVQVFLGPAGSTAYPLHLNEYDVAFWQAQLWGHKAWALVPREWCGPDGKEPCVDQTPLLNPMHHSEHLYNTNVLHADLKRDPDLTRVQGYHTILGAGEILYVPEGTLHQVENVDFNMALTVATIDNSSATYVADLMAKNSFPYCQRGSEYCKEQRHNDELTKFSQALKEFREHADEGIQVHSPLAFCRVNETSVSCPFGNELSANCPIKWGTENHLSQWIEDQLHQADEEP